MIVWADDTGTFKFERPDLSVKEICEFMSLGLADKDMNEIESFMCRVHSYNLWLRNTCGSLLAMIRWTEKELNTRIAKGWKSLSKQYASNEIKEAMICEKDHNAKELRDKLNRLRMKYDKLSKLPQSIDSFIRTIENSIRRKHGA